MIWKQHLNSSPKSQSDLHADLLLGFRKPFPTQFQLLNGPSGWSGLNVG